jgi:hypothetical protein
VSAVVVQTRFNTARTHSAATDPVVTSDTAAGFRPGDYWINTATGNIWIARSVAAGAAVWGFVPRTLGQAVGPADHTGDTTHTKVASVLVPAGAMGTNGQLDIEANWSNNNNGNNKTRSVYFSATDAIAGTAYSATNATTTIFTWFMHRIRNMNAANAQQGSHASSSAGSPGSFSGVVTSAIDTTADAYVVFSVQLADAGDSVGLDYYRVTLTRPDIGA